MGDYSGSNNALSTCGNSMRMLCAELEATHGCQCSLNAHIGLVAEERECDLHQPIQWHPLAPPHHHRWMTDPARANWDIIVLYLGQKADYACPLCTAVGARCRCHDFTPCPWHARGSVCFTA